MHQIQHIKSGSLYAFHVTAGHVDCCVKGYRLACTVAGLWPETNAAAGCVGAQSHVTADEDLPMSVIKARRQAAAAAAARTGADAGPGAGSGQGTGVTARIGRGAGAGAGWAGVGLNGTTSAPGTSVQGQGQDLGWPVELGDLVLYPRTQGVMSSPLAHFPHHFAHVPCTLNPNHMHMNFGAWSESRAAFLCVLVHSLTCAHRLHRGYGFIERWSAFCLEAWVDLASFKGLQPFQYIMLYAPCIH